MESESRCSKCNCKISSYSTVFSCCNPRQIICIFCCKYPCPRCHQIRYYPVQKIQCKRCYSSIKNMFYEHVCDSYYCYRCLVHSPESGNDRKLPCGHQCSKQQFDVFMSNFCSECGETYDNILDYELKNGSKICFRCYKYNKISLDKQFLRCISCDKIIRTSKDKAQSENIDICTDCFEQSALQQKIIINDEIKRKKSRELFPPFQQPFKQLNPQHLAHQVIQPNHQEEVAQEVQIIPLSGLGTLKSNNNLLLPKKQLSALGKFQQNYVQEKKQQSEQKKQQSEQKKQQSEQKRSKILQLRKHFSVEDYVQNFDLEVQVQYPQNKYVCCKECRYILLAELALKIPNKQNQIIQICQLCFISQNPELMLSRGGLKVGIDLAASRNRHSSNQKYKSPFENSYNQTDIKPTKQNREIPVNALNYPSISYFNRPPINLNKSPLNNQMYQNPKIPLNNQNQMYQNPKIIYAQMPICQSCTKESRKFYIGQNRQRLCLDCYNKLKKNQG